MIRWFLALAAFAHIAHADGDRCTAGVAAAKQGELARAALYLEGCTAADGEAAYADVQKKLRASQLSALSISGDPALVIETDAAPGEKLQAPVTVWTKAGTYTIKGATDDGRTSQNTVKLAAHSRATVLLTVPPKAQKPPKNGSADFTDEAADPPQSGPPPAQKHPSLLPCRYDGCDTQGGQELADPLAARADFIPPHPAAYRLGVRGGVAATTSGTFGPALALDAHFEAPWEDTAEHHPFEIDVRPLEWARSADGVQHFTASAGLDRVVADPDAAWIAIGVALRGELRTGGAMSTSFGAGADASLELALRKLPIVVGAHYQQGLSDTGEHVVFIELGADWRVFHYRR